MKKIVSQVKTIKSDFSDMAVNHLSQSPEPGADAQETGTQAISEYEKHFIVDDLETGTLVRKTAVHLGLLLDDGVDFAARLNPVRQLKRSGKSGKKPARPHHDIRYRQKIRIEAEDGIELCANLFAPDTDDANQQFPAIVFINSWLMDKHQYLLQARRFARKGYIVLSYSARGWGQSGGVVDVGGRKDMSDISSIIDWLILNAPVDPDNIGFSGISYGSGLSLLGAAHDKRIKTAVCMSGWADLYESFYSEQTPRQLFAKLLVGSSKVSARTDDTLKYMLDGLLKNEHLEEVQAWGKERSAATYLAKYNRRKPPIYLVQNFQDELFHPNSVLDFYTKLKGPKRIDLNKGTHGSAELSGILGLKNHLWLQTHAWFDHWLMGIPNQIMEQPPISCQFERKNRLHLNFGKHEGDRHNLQDWAATEEAMNNFYLCPPEQPGNAGLLSSHPSPTDTPGTLYSGLGSSKSTAGIPLFSSTRSAHLNMPLKLDLTKIPEKLALVYHSAPLEQAMCILGTATLTLRIETTRPQIQLIAYLYDAPEEGQARLVTHGPMTRHLVQPNEPFEVSFELLTTCYEIDEAHRLVLAIDTSELQYQAPTKDDFKVTFHYAGGSDPLLKVPMIPAAGP